MWKNGDATIRFGTGEGPFAAPEPEPDVPTPETPVTPVAKQLKYAEPWRKMKRIHYMIHTFYNCMIWYCNL